MTNGSRQQNHVFEEHSHTLQIYWSTRDVITWLAENSDDEHLKKVKQNLEGTMFTLWIGTNDVGSNALLTGSQTPGVTVVNTTSCAVNFIRTMYHEFGARNFLFQNVSLTASLAIQRSS